MLLHVYSPQSPPWIVVNGQPSPDAVDAHGALRLEGSFRIDRLTDTERTLVLGEMRALTYALIPITTARRLMAHSPIRQLRGHFTRWLPSRLASCPRA
jgi:hypothetical protein